MRHSSSPWALLVLSGCVGLASLGGQGGGAATGGGGGGGGTGGGGGARPDAGVPDGGLARYPVDTLHSPLTPFVAARLRLALAAHPRQPGVFMKLGDNNHAPDHFLGCFDVVDHVPYDLGAHGELQATLAAFQATTLGGTVTSFSRAPLTVGESLGAQDELTPLPSRLQQEVDAIDPAFASLSFGIGEAFTGGDHLPSLGNDRARLEALGPWVLEMVEALLDQGVVPLVRSPPRTHDEAGNLTAILPTFGAVLRGIAEAHQVPFADFQAAAFPLPHHGMDDDSTTPHLSPFYDSSLSQCDLTDAGLRLGINLMNLVTLEQLDRVRRATAEGQAVDPASSAAPPIDGVGSAGSPRVVDHLPFTDFQDLGQGLGPDRADYSGACGGSSGETLPSVVYRLDVATGTKVHAGLVGHRAASASFRLHHFAGDLASCLGSDGASARESALLELTLAPGTHFFVVDGVPRAGARPPRVLFFVTACEPNEACGG